MRAAVSLIMSHGAGETVKAHPDYVQTAHHHACLLVLLRGVGPAEPRTLQKAFDKVRQVNTIKVTDSVGNMREIWVRYVHDLPVENNDWGDFQTHRRLLGLITIGKFDNQTELNELCRQHESLKVRYGSTLYDSRAIFFVPSSNANEITNNHHINNHKPQQQEQQQKSKNHQEYVTPALFKAQAFFYDEHDDCKDLEAHIAEFIRSLFWVLESKRIERSRKEVSKINTLLLAPFESRDFVGRDEDTRTQNKRCLGRIIKNLGDLSLQAGLIEDSLNLYHKACDTLRSINDLCWLGAAEEGLCAASAILHYPHLRDNYPLFNNNNNINEVSNHKEHTNVENNSRIAITSASSSCSSVSSLLTNNSTASATSSPCTSNSTSSSTSTLSAKALATTTTATTQRNCSHELPRNILKAEEIPATYRCAIINYSKYTHAAVVETEAALKSARICIEQRRPLDVVMCLQNILHRNLKMSEQERVKRFEIIASLYLQISYGRKAAFFQRLAALQHAQQGNNSPDWTQTYRLLLESFPGYMLTLDPLEVLERSAGWPVLQIDLLQRLISAAVRLGYSALATRHMTFLLQTQWHNMTSVEQSEFSLQLQNLSSQCEGSPVPLKLENVPVIPPANLTDLPYCMSFAVKDLAAYLRPQRIRVVKSEGGPFLFTPIHFSSIDRREKKKEKNKISFFWVQNDLSEVCIRLRNPLPYELTVNDMRLLTNGIVFESLPQTIVLEPNVPTYVTLKGTPIEVGQLEVLGYSTHTLGVKSNCRLEDMRARHMPPNYLVDVIPALPKISAATSLSQGVSSSNTLGSQTDTTIASACLTLYNGESASWMVTLTNESSLPVEHLELSIHANVELETQRKIFRFDEQELQAKLPLASKASLDFTVHIYAEADFICPLGSQRAASVHSGNNAMQPDLSGPQSLPYSTFSSSGHASLPSQMSSPHRRNEPTTSSFRSASSAAPPSLAHTLNMPMQQQNQLAQHVEAQFRIKYSGGQAMAEGYCRQCSIACDLELLPSAQITSWDVLPAEIPSQFYLVLDISNLTNQEMSLNYTENKSIHIEAKESCRVPIPVDRCSLEEVCAAREAEYAENMERELCFRTQLLSFTDAVSKLCAEHITDRVKISWHLTGTDIKGIASLRGIALSPSMTDLTTVSPLQWTIKFQDAIVQPQSEIVCTAGQRCVISVAVCNQSIQPLRNLVLSIQFYQDYLNGMEDFNLKTRLAFSGPNKISIPLLRKDEDVVHVCSVIFFAPGRFKTSIQCVSKPDIVERSSMTALTRSCPVPESTTTTTNLYSDNSIPNNNINNKHADNYNATAASYHHDQQQHLMYFQQQQQQQEHIWKFIPPIELTVMEGLQT